jgi:hypothetical protein
VNRVWVGLVARIGEMGNFGRKPDVLRTTRIRKDNIKMEDEETEWEFVDRINL